MLTESDLLSLTCKPSMSDVSLQLYANFYETYLMNKVFVFALDNEPHNTVHIQFGRGDLPHLLGIQHVVEDLRNKNTYTGERGFEKLKNGSMDFDWLKNTHKEKFKSKKNRMLYFPFIYQVLNNPTVILFNNTGVTKISADLMLYNQLNNTYFHLGIIRDNVDDYYSPVTFYDRNNTDHINGQATIAIMDKSIISAPPNSKGILAP